MCSMHTSKLFPYLKHSTSDFVRSLCTVAPEILPKWSTTAKTHDWNRAVSDGERIVGYPTTFFSLKYLLSEEITSVAVHLRRLMGTNHPILRTAKRLVYHGRTNMQTRGLIVLLLSKAAGQTASCSDSDTAAASGITERQHTLAEITEMIHTAHLVHRGIQNLSAGRTVEGVSADELQFGNKISILCGDFLLSNACKGLASLRNCKVVDMISKSIADFMQAEFLGDHDQQLNPIPIHGMSVATWEEKYCLSSGSLLANSCKSALELAGHGLEIQDKAFQFGLNVALAWQAYAELQPFVDSLGTPPGTQFDLCSLPVIFHLEKHPEMVEKIRSEIGNDATKFDFKRLYDCIVEGDGVERTKQLHLDYSRKADDFLPELGSSAPAKAISNIINSLRS